MPPAPPDPFAPVGPRLAALNAAGRPVRVLRLWRPWPIVAFSRRDERSPRFAQARDAAQAAGFQAALRPVGGSFAPLHGGSLVVDEYGWDAAPLATHARFDRHTDVLLAVFRAVGLDARRGEVPGEYCPGEHSVNVAGRTKISGTAQRVSRNAWLVSSVVQVHGADALRRVTASVAEAFDRAVDPAALGVLEESSPGVDLAGVAADLAAAFVDGGVSAVEQEL